MVYGERGTDSASPRLDGRVAIVTGGAKGIGRYIAHTFAQHGANVVIADVDEPYLAQTEAELRDLGVEARAFNTNVRDEDAVQALMAQTAEQFGRIDVLVNNAAIVTHFNWGVPRWPAVRDMDKAFWDRVIDTNLGGTFLCTKHVLPYLERQGAGHVLNVVTTVNGSPTNLGSCVYATSKAAIRQFTAFVAEEERPHGVTILGIAVDQPIANEYAPEEARQRMAGPEVVGDRFVLATGLGIEQSGQSFTLRDGALVVQD